MEVTKEYIVAPKLAHHLIGMLIGAAIAGACGYLALTNTSGSVTRRTNLSAEELTLFYWVLAAAGALFVLIVVAEMIVTRIRPAAKITITPTHISIPMNSLIKTKTIKASYAQITGLALELSAPNRLLRIQTSEGDALVAELNLAPGMFDDLYATLKQWAPRV